MAVISTSPAPASHKAAVDTARSTRLTASSPLRMNISLLRKTGPALCRPGPGSAFGGLDAGHEVLQLGIGDVLFVHRLHRIDEGLLVHFIDGGAKRLHGCPRFLLLGGPEFPLVG